MATVINARDVLLLAASPRLLWTGIRGITVSSSTSVFKVSNIGVPSPSSISLTTQFNGVSGTVTWSVPFGSASLSTSGNSATLIYNNMFTDVIRVKASLVVSGVLYESEVTLSKVVDGATGSTGSTGAQGAGARIAYSLIDGNSLNVSPSSVTLTGDVKPTTGTWGETRAWVDTPPTPSAGQSVFQTTSTYNPATNQITWVVPYLSNLKVGQLSVISADMGTITAGSLTANVTIVSNGNIKARGLNSNQSSIWGDNPVNGGIGVYGSCPSGTGVFGEGSSSGVFGTSSTGDAVNGQTSSGFGVRGFAATTGTGGYFASVSGYSILADGKVLITETNETALRATQSSSGNLVAEFTNNGSGKTLTVGGTSYAAYSGSGQGKIYAVDGFTPFTASHNGLLLKDVPVEIGDIICDVAPILKMDISNTLGEVCVSTTENDKRAVGVYVSKEFFDDNLVVGDDSRYDLKPYYDLISFNSSGEGQINVCGVGGDIEVGDLIVTSSIRGKGCKQSDDIVRNYTLAKSRERVVFTTPTEVKQIACIYLAG